MNYSKYGWVLVLFPSLALAQMSVLGLHPHECTDQVAHFKLLLWGPVVEELVFRAGLQQWLSRKWHSNEWANFASSCVFSLLHYQMTQQVMALWVFVPSMLLGALYGKTQSLVWAIALHIVFNLIHMLWACPIIGFAS